jgi:hypothetical protein
MRHVFQFPAENAEEATFGSNSSRRRLLTQLARHFATENQLPEAYSTRAGIRRTRNSSFGWNAHDFNPRSHQGTDGRVGFRRIGHQQSDC